MRSIWKIALVALAVLALGGTATGIALAQSGDDGDATPETQEAPADEETQEAPEAEGKECGRHGGGEALAEFLGITVDELQEARAGEQSLAQIAEANGVSRDGLIIFLVGQIEDKLAAKVEEGRIDQEQADDKLDQLEERVEDRVDSTDQDRPHRRHRDGSAGFPGRFAPEDETADLTSA